MDLITLKEFIHLACTVVVFAFSFVVFVDYFIIRANDIKENKENKKNKNKE